MAMPERRGGTLDAGLDILEALSAAPPTGFGVTELARRLQLDKANVHRLLRVLADRGYAEQDPASRRWSGSAQLLTLAGGVLLRLDIRAVAQPVLLALVTETGEAAHLAVRTSTAGVYVAQERPTGRISVETEIGGVPVLHATATGKALLAGLDRSTWRALITLPLRRFTPHTVRSLAGLEAELDQTRARGYAVDDEEYQVDVRCVAAPVLDFRGDIAGSIGISGPTSRVPKSRLAELGAAARDAATEATRSLGGIPLAMTGSDVIARRDASGTE